MGKRRSGKIYLSPSMQNYKQRIPKINRELNYHIFRNISYSLNENPTSNTESGRNTQLLHVYIRMLYDFKVALEISNFAEDKQSAYRFDNYAINFPPQRIRQRFLNYMDYIRIFVIYAFLRVEATLHALFVYLSPQLFADDVHGQTSQ